MDLAIEASCVRGGDEPATETLKQREISAALHTCEHLTDGWLRNAQPVSCTSDGPHSIRTLNTSIWRNFSIRPRQVTAHRGCRGSRSGGFGIAIDVRPQPEIFAQRLAFILRAKPSPTL